MDDERFLFVDTSSTWGDCSWLPLAAIAGAGTLDIESTSRGDESSPYLLLTTYYLLLTTYYLLLTTYYLLLTTYYLLLTTYYLLLTTYYLLLATYYLLLNRGEMNPHPKP